MHKNKIAIIGCGNLGLSIVHGLLDKKVIPPAHITATRRNIKNLESLQHTGINITDDNVQAVEDSDIIIVALKPYKILVVLAELKPHFKPNKHILASLATGISIAEIQSVIQTDVPVFRVMPNTAADVAMSMSCIASNSTNSVAIDSIKACFDAIGESIMIDEDLMNSATVLGACGIAYALRFIRAMIQGGIEIGFDAQTATEIVTHTVSGASELLIQRKQHPEFEIDKVTTPKGCTIAGLNEMEHNGFSSALIKGIVTSFEKIK